MSLTLFAHNDRDARALEILIAAKYAGQELNVSTSQPEGFNVAGKIPALQTAEGGFWEVNSILRHLARLSPRYPLYGKSVYEASLIDTWMDWVISDIEGPAYHIYPLEKLEGKTPEEIHVHVDRIKASLDTLNKHLANNTFLASNRVTIADLSLAFALLPLFTEVFDAGARKSTNNVVRWFETVINQPKFLEIFGDVHMLSAKTPLPPVPKKQPQKKGGKKKGDDDDGPDEPEMEEAGEKLDIGYLSELPPSTFNLEHWKTKYANTIPSRPEATDYFWQHFDPAGWSLYYYTYNYPEECTLDFKTANLFGGFLQRAEAVKNLAKYSMTSMVTLKQNNLFYIHGIWLFRGTEIPPPFTKVDDVNYYTVTKVII
jgi:elongation factor 1-gamma